MQSPVGPEYTCRARSQILLPAASAGFGVLVHAAARRSAAGALGLSASTGSGLFVACLSAARTSRTSSATALFIVPATAVLHGAA